MTEAIEKTTVPNPSAATDGEQSLHKESTSSITERTEKCKEEDSEDIFARIRRMQNPNYLHTVTLEELYETVYESSPPIVERLLWPGTYLFVGAHKLCMLLVHHTRKQQSDDKFDMISGTNGLLGAADGAFLIQKLVRLKPGITVDVSGRDQQDQRLTFERNPENLRWELENVAVEAWTAPPEPVLEAVAKQLPESGMQWQGQPSQLVELLGLEISPIALTKRLNVNADRLMQDYGIRYQWRRSHEGRIITLQKLEQEA